MIKLFITDLDGCISTPFKSPDWEVLTEIRKLNNQHRTNETVPPLSICSGRPLSYVEAVGQWLDISHPVGFENAGIYTIPKNELLLLPGFDEGAEKEVHELKAWLRSEVVPHYSDAMIEFTKKMDAGFIHPSKDVIDEVYPRVVKYVGRHYPRFEVHKTEVSVNTILKENNKKQGILKLCELTGISPKETAYIGDSSGDIPGLEIVGYPFAPKNAVNEVKEHAQVLEKEVTNAVLEGYRRTIEINRALKRDEGGTADLIQNK